MVQRPKGLQMLHLSIRKYGPTDAIYMRTSSTTFGLQEPEFFGQSAFRPVSYPDGNPVPWPGGQVSHSTHKRSRTRRSPS